MRLITALHSLRGRVLLSAALAVVLGTFALAQAAPAMAGPVVGSPRVSLSTSVSCSSINGVSTVKVTAKATLKNGGTISGGVMIFTFLRADSSETPDVTLTVETGTDLLTWPAVFTIGTNTAASSPGVSITENGTAPDTITVTLPQGTATRLFARLKVTVAP